MPNPIKKTRPAGRNSQSNTSKIGDANLFIYPECGAEFTSEVNCQLVFDECLAREFTDPKFGSVHHLTVRAYLLQHSSKLSRNGWVSLRQLLREFLVENKSPREIRRQVNCFVNNGNRYWKISSHIGTSFIDRRIWATTILGVHRDEYNTYFADITEWAWAVMFDSEAIDLMVRSFFRWFKTFAIKTLKKRHSGKTIIQNKMHSFIN